MPKGGTRGCQTGLHGGGVGNSRQACQGTKNLCTPQFPPVLTEELRDRVAVHLQAAKEVEMALKDAEQEADKQQRAAEKEAERQQKEAEWKQKEEEKEAERQQEEEKARKARKAAAAVQLKVQKETKRAEKLQKAAAAKAEKGAAKAAEKAAKEVGRAGQKCKNDEYDGLDTPREAVRLVDSLTCLRLTLQRNVPARARALCSTISPVSKTT